MKILYIDTETTGLDPKINDIIQLSGMIEINGEVKETFNFDVKPLNIEAISEEALKVTGKTKEEILAYPEAKEIYRKFVAMLDRYVSKYDRTDKMYVAGYNVRFDVEFLKAFFDKAGNPYFGSYINWKTVDPMPIMHFLEYIGMLSLENYKLSTVCEYFKIPLQAHDAMSDIKATRALLKHLEGGFLVRDFEGVQG